MESINEVTNAYTNLDTDDKLDPRRYEPDDLQVFNLLQHPTWVFDIERRKMYFANKAAIELWNADSLGELLRRDFKTGLSDTIAKRMDEQLMMIKRGEVLHEQWTAYPKGKPKTFAMTGSGIRLQDGRVAVLAETELPNHTAFSQENKRNAEILRYLPMAVSQFDINGNLEYQNPQDMTVFGGAATRSKENRAKENTDQKESERSAIEKAATAAGTSTAFLDRFVDPDIGRSVLKQVQEENEVHVEAEQYTADQVPRTYSLSIRKTTDPVTNEPILLHSARDITSIMKARQDTKKAALKSDFMAIIAHEIRTPLHQIIGYVDLLEASALSDEQQEQILTVQSAAESLNALANDMLDYSKLEHNNMVIEKIEFSPSSILDECLASVEHMAGDKELELCLSKIGLSENVLGDPHRLKQILTNLLTNAIKYTKQGTVTIRAQVVGDASASNSNNRIEEHNTRRVRFEVCDTGVGIHPDSQVTIFQLGVRGAARFSNKYGGSGLGLWVCQNLTDAMGGTISLTSTLGRGSTFSVVLPFELPPIQIAKPSLAAIDELKISGKKILVAEDNLMNQKLMRVLLERMGHTVTIAENGQIAYDLIDSEEVTTAPYNLVLMDVQMPVCDGLDSTKMIRKRGWSKATLPIVGVTASFQESELDFYLDVGMNFCVGKPVRMNALKEIVEQYAIKQQDCLSQRIVQ